MKKKIFLHIFYILITCGIYFSCEPTEKYPETPVIQYESFKIKDSIYNNFDTITIGLLTFTFTDGDGDVGMENDTSQTTDSLRKYNLFITPYKKNSGQFQPVKLKLPNYFRIPYLDPEGPNKTLKGKIMISLSLTFMKSQDTAKFEFFIYDRAFHKSNTETTPEIIFPQ